MGLSSFLFVLIGGTLSLVVGWAAGSFTPQHLLQSGKNPADRPDLPL